jgi:hypothetical protein
MFETELFLDQLELINTLANRHNQLDIVAFLQGGDVVAHGPGACSDYSYPDFAVGSH